MEKATIKIPKNKTFLIPVLEILAIEKGVSITQYVQDLLAEHVERELIKNPKNKHL